MQTTSTTSTTTTTSKSSNIISTTNSKGYSTIKTLDDEEDMYRREVVFKLLYITKFLANGI